MTSQYRPCSILILDLNLLTPTFKLSRLSQPVHTFFLKLSRLSWPINTYFWIGQFFFDLSIPTFLIDQFFLDLSIPIFNVSRLSRPVNTYFLKLLLLSWPVDIYFFNQSILLLPLNTYFWIGKFFCYLSIPISESMNNLSTCWHLRFEAVMTFLTRVCLLSILSWPSNVNF